GAAPYIGANPRRIPKHLPINIQTYRLTLLTFSGMYVIEVPTLNEIQPVVEAGARLLTALTYMRDNPPGNAELTESPPPPPSRRPVPARKRSRWAGLVLLAPGFIFAAYAAYVYVRHSRFNEVLLWFAPLCFLFGIAGLVEPHISGAVARYVRG